MKRVVLIVVGLVALLVGYGAAAGGAALAAVVGGNGSFSVPVGTASTDGVALVSTVLDLRGWSDHWDWGRITVRVTSGEGRPLFLGIGPTADVDRYLQGSAYGVVDSIRQGEAVVRSVPGDARPEPPQQQTFWLAQAGGTPSVEVRTDLTGSAGYRVVVMNDDATPGVFGHVRVGAVLPWAYPLGIGVMVAGLVGLLLGVILLLWGLRTPPSPAAAPGAPAAAG